MPPAFSTLTTEIGSAVSAKQFGGQQIIVPGLMAGRGFSVFLRLLLKPVKEIMRNNLRDSIRNKDVSILIFANVAPVF